MNEINDLDYFPKSGDICWVERNFLNEPPTENQDEDMDSNVQFRAMLFNEERQRERLAMLLNRVIFHHDFSNMDDEEMKRFVELKESIGQHPG